RRDPKAKKLMAEHLERFPDTDKAGAALYFLRRYTLLVERYPFSYYSTLVREKITPASVARIDPAVFSASDGMTRRVERALQLERAGFADWAEFELKNAAGEQPFVAAMAMAEMMG